MEPETEQTSVADDSYGTSEATSSGDSELELDSLLNQFERETTPKPEPKPQAPQQRPRQADMSKLDPVIKFAEAEMRRTQQETFDRDVNAAVEKIRTEDAFKGLPEKLVRRMTIAYAFDNKGFDEAFQNRSDDPAAWDRALKQAASDLAEEVADLKREEPDTSRDDIEAATAAVRDVVEPSSEDEGPSAAEKANWSDAKWQQYIEEKLAM